jgi:hypothetical protein
MKASSEFWFEWKQPSAWLCNFEERDITDVNCDTGMSLQGMAVIKIALMKPVLLVYTSQMPYSMLVCRMAFREGLFQLH